MKGWTRRPSERGEAYPLALSCMHIDADGYAFKLPLKTAGGGMNRREWIWAITALEFSTTRARAGLPRTSTLKPANRTAYTPFKPFAKMGGVLGFAVFDGAANDEVDARAAIHDTLLPFGRVDDGELNALHPRRLNEAQFFGDWYDPSSGDLVWNGSVTVTDGRHLTRPTFRALDGVKVRSSGSSIPDMGEGGQFAYAFANPPYGLTGSRGRVQAVFDSVRHTLLPSGHACTITDWTSPDLDKVSAYFTPGKEWWGVFLFTVRDATTGRLTVIIGSATD